MNMRPLGLLALLASAGSAIAQPPPSDQPRQPDPLRGPQVRDRQVPGVNGSFGEPGGDKKRFVNENRLPPRVFRDAMQPIMSPDAPENLRLTDEKRTRYQGWMDDFQKTIGEYMKQHREELGGLAGLVAQRQRAAVRLQDAASRDQPAVPAAIHERHVGHLDHHKLASPVEARLVRSAASGDVELATDLHDPMGATV